MVDYQDLLQLSQYMRTSPESSEGSPSLNNSITEEEVGKFRPLRE